MSGGSAVEISQKENGADFWKKKNKRIYTHAMGRRLKERRLILPESYEKIEREALKNNVRLRTVCLPKQIESIGVQAFMNCTSLYQIEYTDIVRIQREAFCGCNHLVSFLVPESTVLLGKGAFSYCRALQQVEFAHRSRLKELEAAVFEGCEKLQTVKLPELLEHIGERAFYKCSGLSELHFPESVAYIGKEAFYQNGFLELELPRGLQVIETGAFSNCRKLEQVMIPESVRVLENRAFRGCHRLKTLEIHHDPERIGECIINRSTVVRCKAGSKVEAYCRKYEIQTVMI